MNKENLILRCMSILLSDPDGNNEQIRVMLMGEIKNALHPEKSKEEDCCEMPKKEKYPKIRKYILGKDFAFQKTGEQDE